MPSVADEIVASLGDAGVRSLFGMPGGGSNLDLLDAAGRAGLRFVLTATETAGAIAALAQAETLHHRGPSVLDVRIDPSSYAATLKAVRG